MSKAQYKTNFLEPSIGIIRIPMQIRDVPKIEQVIGLNINFFGQTLFHDILTKYISKNYYEERKTSVQKPLLFTI